MRLKTKTDYSIRVLIYLQTHQTKVKIQDIADHYNISKNHLSIATNKLSELGYIKTTSGPKGGIEFNKNAENRTVGGLISEIEKIEIAECFDSENNSCSLNPHCKLKGMLNKATSSFLKELNKFKIKDLT